MGHQHPHGSGPVPYVALRKPVALVAQQVAREYMATCQAVKAYVSLTIANGSLCRHAQYTARHGQLPTHPATHTLPHSALPTRQPHQRGGEVRHGGLQFVAHAHAARHTGARHEEGQPHVLLRGGRAAHVAHASGCGVPQ